MIVKQPSALPELLTVRATADGTIDDDLTPYPQKAGLGDMSMEEALRMDIIALGGALIQRQMDANEVPECPICAVGLKKLCTGFLE